jgi:type II secretory ATPase GspE/PulE/Tfp pilus assembly ATPase PilB-like protein
MPDISKKTADGLEISEEKATEIKSVLSFKEKIENFPKGNTSELLEIIFGGGINLGASDIHIEPEESKSKIRIRLDGLLQDVTTIETSLHESVVSRIKLLSGVKLNVNDRPQDGRFSVLIEKMAPIEIRTSTLPSEHGESVVLRILNPKGLIDLDSLGLRKDLLEIFKREIKKPNGMIIVTGPTGSGKTTTLYAFLKQIQNPEIKIITIEDPIEYHLDGISQTQVSPEKGYDFSSGLQAIVRQDPDVILVGEIRDGETCKIAIQASLTGHLVLSTLHTNDAAGTIARMTSLGESTVNIAPAINLAIAQRLVRKICKKCAAKEAASPLLQEKIKKGLKGVPKNVEIPSLDKGFKILKAKGCEYCNFTGYQGRLGIFEAFLVDEDMERFILKNPSITDLKNEAVKKGMVSVYQDGLIKVLEGITTIEEVERVTGE